MTKFSYEVPIQNLEDFEPYQELYFALSFLCKRPKYFDYMRKKVVEGREVILDNSYNELQKPEEGGELVRIFKDLGASMLVSPNDNKWSIKELESAYTEVVNLVPKEKVLFVVKSKEEYDYFQGLGHHKFATTYEQRPTLPTPILMYSYHFLGFINPMEIRRYVPFSCDTAQPLKLALRGKTMEDWVKEGYPHYKTTPDFFNLTFSKEELDLAKRNCQWIKDNLGGYYGNATHQVEL